MFTAGKTLIIMERIYFGLLFVLISYKVEDV